MASLTEKLASIRRPLTLFVLEWDDIKPFAEIAATFIEARGAPLRMVSRRGSLQDAAEEAARLGSEWIAFRVTPVGPLPRPLAERLVISDVAQLWEILNLRFPDPAPPAGAG